MKTLAAALVGLCVVAAGVTTQSQSRGRGTVPTESGPADLPVLSAGDLAFEERGFISDSELAVIVNAITRSKPGNPEPNRTRRMLLRGLGRLEQRSLIYPIALRLSDPSLSDTAHLGLALTLRANVPPEGPDEEIKRWVDLIVGTAPAPVLGQLPYSTIEQFQKAETRLAAMLDEANGPRAQAARGLEALARRNRKVSPLSPDTIALLKKGARRELPVMRAADDESIARESFAALMAAGAIDAPLIEAALGEESAQFRRLGALALFGAGATVTDAERTRLVRVALDDRDYTVRYDGLRAWVRRETTANGCAPIAEALQDESLHLSLAAIDALGDKCTSGAEAEPLTMRLLAELRTPPDIGSWHREAHALVAIAKRVPERAAMSMSAFRTHNVWQVRMYAARAADVLKDLVTLQKLAYDDDDNVREAALMPLQRLTRAESEAAFIAALGRRDYQLVRTAAMGLKGRGSDKYVLAALVEALDRITAEKKETSRDVRLALVERIREAGASQASVLDKLRYDFDPRIADEARSVLRGFGLDRGTAPKPLPPEKDTGKPSTQLMLARVELDSGRFFEIQFDRDVAPLAYRRLTQLVRDKYYDGLTFHRVVPNFVIQGAAPVRTNMRARRGSCAMSSRSAPTRGEQLVCRHAATTRATRRSSSTSPTIVRSTSTTPSSAPSSRRR